MPKDVKEAYEESKEIFEKQVIPILLKFLGGGEIKIVEDGSIFDLLSGIDAWYCDENGIKGIGYRLQEFSNDFFSSKWRTFTIRKSRISGAKTEYEKRLFSIKNGYLYPDLTLQGYYDKNKKLIAFAIAKTIDIFDMIQKRVCYEKHTGEDQIGQASFFVINWDDMKKEGKWIKIYPDEEIWGRKR